MVNKEKIRRYRKLVIAGILIFSILINGGFFPIVNFNPDNSVELGTVMYLMIIVMACAFHKEIGSLEAVILLKWSAIRIGIFNVVVISCGLACRYLLEFGEVSNTYNFTIPNVVFHVTILTLISTVSCLLDRKKR